MSLENIYYIGQTVAVIAILVSLIFLAIQGRQTQKQIAQANIIAKAELSKSSAEYFLTTVEKFCATPEETAFTDKAFYTMEPLNKHEQAVFLTRMAALFETAAGSTELLRLGLITEDTHARGAQYMCALLVWPRPRKYWAVHRLTGALAPAALANMDEIAERALALPKRHPHDVFNLNTALPESEANANKAQDGPSSGEMSS